MNWWSHNFSQNKYEKLSGFLPSLHRAEILTIFCSYVVWEKWWLYKFILKITDLYLLQTFVTITYIIFGQYVSTKISSILQSMYLLRNKIFHYVWFFLFFHLDTLNKPKIEIGKKFFPVFNNVFHVYLMSGLQKYANIFFHNGFFLNPLYLFWDAHGQAG